MIPLQSSLPLITFFHWLFVVFIVAKLLSTGARVLMGDYSAADASPVRRIVCLTSKVTPSLAALSLAGAVYLRNRRIEAVILIALAAAGAWLATRVLRLREQQRFFGLPHIMLRFMSPRQVKALWLAVLGAVLLVLLRTLA